MSEPHINLLRGKVSIARTIAMRMTLGRLGTKLIIFALTLLILMAFLTGVLVINGFRETERTATAQSVDGLISESRDRLVVFSQQEAELIGIQLQQASTQLTGASRYMLAMEQRAGQVPGKLVGQLERTPQGVYFDSDPGRVSDIWIANFIARDAALDRELRLSAALDTLVPEILEQYPDAVAMYYSGHDGWTRYYPVINLQDLVPADFPAAQELFYKLAVSDANTKQGLIWTPTYVDPAGNGLLVTASIPIYSQQELRGVMGIDISLNRVIERLNTIKATPGGGAFLVSEQGELIAAAPGALQQIGGQGLNETQPLTQTLGMNLLTTPNSELNTIVQHMGGGQNGIEQLQMSGKSFFLSYAPVANIGWSLGVLTPVDEITTKTSAVSAAIRAGTNDTVRSTLVTLAFFFIFALGSVVLLSRNLTRPVVELAYAANRMAAGHFDQPITVTRSDELGTLQQAFKQMVTTLGEKQTALEAQNRELEGSLVAQRRLVDTVQQLSVPLLPLLDDVIVLPIVGHVDGQRSRDLLQALLAEVHQQGIRTVILDITGVPVMDEEIMDLLTRATRAVELLGAHMILAGISGEKAQFIVGTGVDLSRLQTYQDIRTAVGSILHTRKLIEMNYSGEHNN